MQLALRTCVGSVTIFSAMLVSESPATGYTRHRGQVILG